MHNASGPEYDSLMTQINIILNEEMPQVKKDIKKVEAKTKEVEEDIREAMKKKGEPDFDNKELEYLREEKGRLVRKEEQLRQEMHDLRRKEEQLRQEMHDLRQKEEQLRHEMILLKGQEKNEEIDRLRQEMILLKEQKESETLSKFEFKVKENDDFPLHGGGKVLFKRDHFIKNVANMVLEKNKIGEYPSHYWRAPFGSGKTVFLKLLGRELTSRGCDVYMTSGNKMDIYDENYFTELAKQAGDKPVVLLIDEVQNNLKSKHWLDLLKGGKPANLVVLGVGVPAMDTHSPQFDEKYPEGNDLFPMFFTADDLQEVVNYFAKRFPSHAKDVVSEVCQKMLAFTSGHPFPFVKFVNHLLDSTHKLNLETIDTYLLSAEFAESDVREQVRKRCFPAMNSILDKAVNLILLKPNPSDVHDLTKLGLWNNKYFISPLVASEVFLEHNVSRDDTNMVILDETQAKAPYAQQIISAGLRDMTEGQFKDAHADIVALENAIGFQWAFNLRKCLPNVWIAVQAGTQGVVVSPI